MAKEAAKQAACINNQKQVGILFSLYQTDFDNCSPGANSKVGGVLTGHWSKFVDGQPADGSGGVDDGYYGGQNPYGSGTVLRCPKNKQTDASTNVYGVYDGATNNSEDEAFMKIYTSPDATTVLEYFKMSAMRKPSEFMMLGCSLQTNLPSKTFTWQGVYKFRISTLRSDSNANGNWGLWLTHLKTCSGLFGDGHVKSMTGGDLWKTRNGFIAPGNQGIRAWKLEDGTHVIP